MNRTNLKEKFANVSVWKRGGERAPHKPLLLLYALGRLLRDKNRFIPYEDIEKNVVDLLKDFGPSRASYHTEYPFWRLQQDGIWEVENAEKIEITASGDVKKKELLEYHVSGGFSEEIFHALQKDEHLFTEIVQELLDANFPPSIHEDIMQSVGLDLVAPETYKRRDPEFREKILRAYEYRCAVCGFDVRVGHSPVALEAAHIKWKQAGGPDKETNGIALCSLHHKLFDRGAFTLSEQMQIMVSDRANGHCGFDEWLMRFHRKILTAPQKIIYVPDQAFMKWHVKEVFQGEYRELK